MGSDAVNFETMLIPTTKPQERPATMQDIEERMARPPNPRFVQECAAFCDAFRPGDFIVEFCTDRASWNACMGMAGYKLRRAGVDISRLILRMN